MNQKLVSIAIAAMMFAGVGLVRAQEKSDFKTKTGISLGEYYKTYHSRVPVVDENIQSIPAAKKQGGTKSTKALAMPDNFWFPGEFEEVQAVLITWSYVHWDVSGRYYDVMPVNETQGYRRSTGRVVSYKSVIDTSSDTRLPIIFAKLASAIQKGGAQVWINICNAEDSLIVKDYMKVTGYDLENYRFFVNPQNSFWYRDCGPIAFYQGNNDELAFLDFEYYPGRAVDDEIPIHVAEEMNIPVYTTSFELEGGNVILDGLGTLFTSDQLYAANQDKGGQYYISNGTLYNTTKDTLTKNQIHDSLSHLFGLNRLEILPALQYDGGTGHIDLYAAMWDENNFVFTQYPNEMNTFVDYSIASKNIDSILSLHSYHQKKYRGRNIPLPKRDDDTWYQSDSTYATYTRTYSNSLFVNNVIITPVFSDTSWGAREWDLKAISLMQEQFPGYEIIPIDIRGYKGYSGTGFDGSGGAIHCITKQIPAENPVRILHNAIQDYANDYLGEFPISATITNKSGIASATCYWRVKGETEWSSLLLEEKADNEFSAILSRDANINIDTIEYYISATSNNGKTITKPFTAPKGYYSFYYGTDATPEETEEIYAVMDTIAPAANMTEGTDFEPIPRPVGITNIAKEDIAVGNFYPNPAKETAQILISDMNQKQMQVQVVNVSGQTVYANTFTPYSNQVVFQLKVSSFQTGVYTVIFSDNTGKSVAKKLIVQ